MEKAVKHFMSLTAVALAFAGFLSPPFSPLFFVLIMKDNNLKTLCFNSNWANVHSLLLFSGTKCR